MVLSGLKYSVPTYEEMVGLLTSCPELYWKKMAIGLYYLGARESELIRVRARDISFAKDGDDVILVNLPTAKNRRQNTRVLPILKSEELGYDLFLGRMTKAESPAELVFPPYHNFIKVSTLLRTLREKINRFYGFHPHHFRHCRLTHMVTHYGYNSFQLVQYAGWSGLEPATTYVHLNPLDLITKMEEAEERIHLKQEAKHQKELSEQKI